MYLISHYHRDLGHLTIFKLKKHDLGDYYYTSPAYNLGGWYVWRGPIPPEWKYEIVPTRQVLDFLIRTKPGFSIVSKDVWREVIEEYIKECK